MPGVDSNGLQSWNSTNSHSFRKENADHFVLGVSTLLEALLASSSPDLLGDEKITRINLALGARSSAKMVDDDRFELSTFSMSTRRANQLR